MWDIQSDKQISSMTGLESLTLFDRIVDMVKMVSKPKSEKTKITIEEKVFMTYTKLKHNTPYSYLACLFKRCSPTYCKQIFFETIKIISAILREFITWPDPDYYAKNLPKCFESFEDTKVVLDCTQVFIQHPTNFTQQLITY